MYRSWWCWWPNYLWMSIHNWELNSFQKDRLNWFMIDFGHGLKCVTLGFIGLEKRQPRGKNCNCNCNWAQWKIKGGRLGQFLQLVTFTHADESKFSQNIWCPIWDGLLTFLRWLRSSLLASRRTGTSTGGVRVAITSKASRAEWKERRSIREYITTIESQERIRWIGRAQGTCNIYWTPCFYV